MSSRDSPERLRTTIGAVRDLMVKRLEGESLPPEAKHELKMELDALDMMWEELEGQAALLARESERYAEFFEYAPDAYVITDIGGGIREANQAALELLKAPRAGIIGEALSQYIAPEDRVSFRALSMGTTLGGAVHPPAWRAHLQPQEGTALYAEFSVRAIPLKKSGIGGLCWLVRPVL